MKWVDIPPIWLALMVAIAWGLKGSFGSLSFGDGFASQIGTVLVIVGLSLMIVAVLQMTKRQTTPIPHLQASVLVTDGIFAISRNPIYLGDVLILCGLILRWNAPLAIPLIAIFVLILKIRFILPEEERLLHKFSADFLVYTKSTRRWL